MTTSIVARYLEIWDWPMLQDSQGTVKSAGDNYGDIECPFCDYVICTEGNVLSIGDRCRKCSGTVVSFRNLRQQEEK